MKRFFNIIVIVLCNIGAYSQETTSIIPPSPEPASLIKFVNTPVNHYTGVPQISVPIYQIEGRRLNVPVGINYHARGIKVNEIASTAGLGWTLNAGGVITRVVRGLPDDVGYCGEGQHGKIQNDPETSFYEKSVLKGAYDGEPDVFYFNFLGRTGRFVFDADGVVHTIPYSNVKIEPAICVSGDGEWKIIDEKGIQYIFGDKDSNDYQEETKSETFKWYESQNDFLELEEKEKQFISTWYLKEIVLPNGVIEFSFKYEKGNDVEVISRNSYKYDVLYHEYCSPSPSEKTEIFKKVNTTINPLYVSEITSPNGKVEFKYSTDRKDYNNGFALKKIKVSNNTGLIQEYNLVQDYFKASIPDQTVDKVNWPQCEDENCLRLRLDQIMRYNSETNEYTLFRKFKYNDRVNLPPRNSVYSRRYIDHWGYFIFNSSEGPDWPNLHTNIPGVTLDDGSYIYGAQKWPNDYELTAANILEEVILPTGGKEVFEFVGNSFEDSDLGKTIYGEGLKVSKIHRIDDHGNKYTTSYEYNDYYNFSNIKYHYQYKNFADVRGFSFGLPGGGSVSFTVDCYEHFVVRSSKSFNEINDLAGVSIGYTKIKEINTDGSYKTYEYYGGESEFQDVEPEVKSYFIQANNDFISLEKENEPSNGPPFTAKTYRGWNRGLIKKEEIWDDNGNILKSIEYDYYFDLAKINIPIPIEGYTISSYSNAKHGANQVVGQIVHVGTYDWIIKPIKQKSKVVKNYSGENEYSTTTNYFLNRDKEIYRVEQSTSDENVKVGSFKLFANNYSSSNIIFINNFKIGNLVTVPIEEIEYIKVGDEYKITKAKLTRYNKFNSLPESTEIIPIDEPLSLNEVKISNLSIDEFIEFGMVEGAFVPDERYQLLAEYEFDDYGNLVNISSRNGITKAYSYDANNFYPVKQTITSGDLQQETNYEYEDMVGITETIDQNQHSTHYEYDELKRLNLIKDNEGNIINRYTYQYKIPDPEIVVSKHNIDLSETASETFEIFTDKEWEIVKIGPGSPWFTLSQSTGTGDATITVTKNDDFGLNYQLGVKLINEDDVVERIDLILN